ncbi:MAG: flagellar biosynthetic protein FliO [Nitrospirales bacterium]|nr:flagellar biosynthetic protein FliO [Nitrospirales bacterium]
MDFGHEVIKMTGALALVVLLLLGILVWARKTFGETGSASGESVMRVMGGLRLGAGKQIVLVEVAGEVLVLGTTNREMTLLTRIKDEQRIASLRTVTHPVLNTLDSWIATWKSGIRMSRANPTSSQIVKERVLH